MSSSPATLVCGVAALFLFACSSSDDVLADDGGDLNAEQGASVRKIDQVIVPAASIGMPSVLRTARVASIKFAGARTQTKINRCHPYSVGNIQFVICRDAAAEIVMDVGGSGGNESDLARGVRQGFVRFASDPKTVQWLTCTGVALDENGKAVRGSEGKCKPAPAPSGTLPIWNVATQDPKVDLFPSHSVFLPTLWGKTPAQSFRDWSPQVARAIPDGLYNGQRSNRSEPCQVKVATVDGKTNVTVFWQDGTGEDSSGGIRVELSPASSYGALRLTDLPQGVSGSEHKASVLIMSTETETTTNSYSSHNVRVVRIPERPATDESGETAVYVEGTYCSRLNPKIAPW